MKSFQIRSSNSLLATSFVISILTLCPSSGVAQTYTVIHDFCLKSNCSDGDGPANLLPNGSGGYFGSTTIGGAYGGGLVFELTPGQRKWKLEALHNFCSPPSCADGDTPNGGLILDTSGNLYGTAKFGNQTANQGVVFKLGHGADRKKWKIEILYSFCTLASCTDGEQPNAGLSYAGQSGGSLYDGKSPLYGTTVEGGTNNEGVVFELQRIGKNWTETALYSFCPGGYPCVDGDEPQGLIVQGLQNLVGVVPNGGLNGAGAVFEVSPGKGGSWNETTLYGFCSAAQCTDGAAPWGPLLSDASGNIYGETQYGGLAVNDGVVYELSPTGKESVLHSFCANSGCPDGAGPYGGLIMDASGNLFGVTESGGNEYGGGLVFELNAKYSVLYAFCTTARCKDGEYPVGPMVLDTSGNLFGTTAGGGTGQKGFGGGVAFELTH